MDIQTESSSHKLMGSPNRSPRSRRCRCICLSVTAVILGLGLLFLILGLTVFKVKHPRITINSISLEDLDFAIDMARLRVLLNITLGGNFSVKNPNRVGFKYRNSTATLRYRGGDVGSAPIPAGSIGADDTKLMNLTLSVMADRLMSDPSLYTDAISGTLPFEAYVRISGHVRLLFKIHVVAYATCYLNIDLGNQTISIRGCHYRTRL